MENEKEAPEIEDWIEENPLAKALLKKSNLKKGELKALLLYYQSEDTSFAEISSKLGINRSGAWKRWKKGYKKIIESFFTIQLAAYGGMLEPKTTKLVTEILQDYLRLTHGKGDKEAIRERLEKKMMQIEKQIE